jgi:hypothetical protein
MVNIIMMLKSRKRWIAAIGISMVFVASDLLASNYSSARSPFLNWAPCATMVIWIAICCIRFGRSVKGDRRRRTIFRYGMKITMIAAVVITVFRLVSITLLFPGDRTAIMMGAKEEIEKRGSHSANEIHAAIGFVNDMLIPSAIAGSLLISICCGLAGSCIGAVFSKFTKESFIV